MNIFDRCYVIICYVIIMLFIYFQGPNGELMDATGKPIVGENGELLTPTGEVLLGNFMIITS